MEGKHIAERAGEAGLLQYELENNRLLNALRCVSVNLIPVRLSDRYFSLAANCISPLGPRMRREFSDVLQYINEKKVYLDRHIGIHETGSGLPRLSGIRAAVHHTQATLLVPQSVTLSDLHVNRSFIETHVMMSFDSYPGRFVSVNGVRAVYSTDDWYVLRHSIDHTYSQATHNSKSRIN
jgi:hypothetical protein